MHFLTIAIILTAAAISTAASTSSSVESSLLDSKGALKVNKTANYDTTVFTAGTTDLVLKNVLSVCEEKNFYTLVEEICKDKASELSCREREFGTLKAMMLALKTEAIRRLDKETTALGDVASKFSSSYLGLLLP